MDQLKTLRDFHLAELESALQGQLQAVHRLIEQRGQAVS
jgi:hypothetical protein